MGGLLLILAWIECCDAVTIDQECVGYALECVRLAGLTEDQHTRERLFEIGRHWMAAATRGKTPEGREAIGLEESHAHRGISTAPPSRPDILPGSALPGAFSVAVALS